MKATYYNHISVRDQLLSAEKNSKCELDYGIPRNILTLKLNESEWTATCDDPCTPGFCEVHVFVFIPDAPIPKTINLYFVKRNAIAFISFISEVMDDLKEKGILDPGKLQIEKSAPKILPDALIEDKRKLSNQG